MTWIVICPPNFANLMHVIAIRLSGCSSGVLKTKAFDRMGWNQRNWLFLAGEVQD